MGLEFLFISEGPGETIRCGKVLGGVLAPGSVVGLIGELGTGKTCFIKGLASTLSGVSEDEVTSPTFIFMQEFPGKIPLYHFDLYRIMSSSDLRDLGFEEYLYSDGVIVIEWADRAEGSLPDEHLMIRLEHINENCRRLTFKACGEKYKTILDNFTHAVEGGA